jgi:hypothetical protein
LGARVPKNNKLKVPFMFHLLEDLLESELVVHIERTVLPLMIFHAEITVYLGVCEDSTVNG